MSHEYWASAAAADQRGDRAAPLAPALDLLHHQASAAAPASSRQQQWPDAPWDRPAAAQTVTDQYGRSQLKLRGSGSTPQPVLDGMQSFGGSAATRGLPYKVGAGAEPDRLLASAKPALWAHPALGGGQAGGGGQSQRGQPVRDARGARELHRLRPGSPATSYAAQHRRRQLTVSEGGVVPAAASSPPAKAQLQSTKSVPAWFKPSPSPRPRSAELRPGGSRSGGGRGGSMGGSGSGDGRSEPAIRSHEAAAKARRAAAVAATHVAREAAKGAARPVQVRHSNVKIRLRRFYSNRCFTTTCA